MKGTGKMGKKSNGMKTGKEDVQNHGDREGEIKTIGRSKTEARAIMALNCS